MKKFLAVDFGAESGRAVVGWIDGGRIRMEEIHRFSNRQVTIEGHLHWDINYLFEELKQSLSLAAKHGHDDIESIGIDTWGVDFALVGKDRRLLGLPFSYRDHRTDGIMEQVFKKMAPEEIYSSTGIQFMQFNTLYQLYSVMCSQPEVISACDRLLFLPDLFGFLLTGKEFSEYTIASTSQMLDVRAKSWSEQVLTRVGLPTGIMAPIVFPGTKVGPVQQDILKEAGFTRRMDLVAVGCHDTASAIAAVPASGSNWAYISSGTWSLIGIEADGPIIAEETAGDFTNEGGVGGKIMFLRNVAGMWLLQECRRIWREHGREYSYERLVEMAGEKDDFPSLIDPDDRLFLNPPSMPDAIENYCERTGQAGPSSDWETVRCIFQSLAVKYKSIIQKIQRITGRKIETLHIVGGGSQNGTLNQMTADACGILVSAGPVEATALGNVMVQAIADGEIKSLSEGREIIGRSFPAVNYYPS
jgi:rhamnulokinase